MPESPITLPLAIEFTHPGSERLHRVVVKPGRVIAIEFLNGADAMGVNRWIVVQGVELAERAALCVFEALIN